jgi:hypothetical protein
MKSKVKWTLFILLAAVLVTTAINRTIASNHQQTNQPDHHQHHQQQRNQASALPPLLVDGALNPNAIPDLVAYEFLLNSVADGAGTTEPDRIRAKILVGKTGLSEQKNQALTATANSFRVALAPLNAQAKELKDRNWPTPSSSVLAQLDNLQRQKETILRARFNALLEQLNDDDKEKLNKRILEIKSKVKQYPSIPVEKFQKR